MWSNILYFIIGFVVGGIVVFIRGFYTHKKLIKNLSKNYNNEC